MRPIYKLFLSLAIISIAICALSLISENGEARTATWDGEAANALASSAANWDLDTAPISGDDISFTAGKSCTWDLDTDSFAHFTINGYTNTITIASDLHATGWFQSSATLTGSISYWLYIDGYFNVTETGLLTASVLKLDVSGDMNIRYTPTISSLRIADSADVTLSPSLTLADRLIIGSGADLEVTSGNTLSFGTWGSYQFYNNGTMSGNGLFEIKLFNAEKTMDLGNIECSVKVSLFSSAAAGHILTLGTDTTIGGSLTVMSNHATNTMSVNLGGYDLEASANYIGVRGILTDSVGGSKVTGDVIVNGTGAVLTQGSGKAIEINDDLYLISGAIAQLGTITLNGEYIESGGTLTGNAGYWFIINNGGFSVTGTGLVASSTLNLEVRGDQEIYCRYQLTLLGLKIASSSVVELSSVVYTGNALIIESGSNLVISKVSSLIYSTYGSQIFFNNGTMSGDGSFDVRLYNEDKNWTYGDVDCSVIVSLHASAAADHTMSLVDDINIQGDLIVISHHASYRAILDLNGYNITVGSGKNVIVCDGDSITYGAGSTAGNSYPEVFASLNGQIVYNTAIGGRTAEILRTLFESNVLILNPNYIVILAGINDVKVDTPASDIIDDLDWMVQTARADNVRVILCTLTPRDLNNATQNAILDTVNSWIRNQSANGVIVLDLYPYFENATNPYHLNPSLASDTTHFNDAGYALFAELVYDAYEADMLTIRQPSVIIRENGVLVNSNDNRSSVYCQSFDSSHDGASFIYQNIDIIMTASTSRLAIGGTQTVENVIITGQTLLLAQYIIVTEDLRFSNLNSTKTYRLYYDGVFQDQYRANELQEYSMGSGTFDQTNITLSVFIPFDIAGELNNQLMPVIGILVIFSIVGLIATSIRKIKI